MRRRASRPRAGGWAVSPAAGSRALLAAAALALLPSPASGQAELVEQGNQSYQSGDFVAAVDAYERVLEAGFESADLHYNLGNAYFKSGELGRAILQWERARVLAPNDPDVTANLDLARTLTTDVVEPLPEFWLFTAVGWWVDLLPRGVLVAVVTTAWLLAAGSAVTWILARGPEVRRLAQAVTSASVVVTVVLGLNLAVRETGWGRAERAVVLATSVPVRSAPAEDDNLTLFEVHEGTVVRIDQRAGTWAEVVLEDGKVGWVPTGAIEAI